MPFEWVVKKGSKIWGAGLPARPARHPSHPSRRALIAGAAEMTTALGPPLQWRRALPTRFHRICRRCAPSMLRPVPPGPAHHHPPIRPLRPPGIPREIHPRNQPEARPRAGLIAPPRASTSLTRRSIRWALLPMMRIKRACISLRFSSATVRRPDTPTPADFGSRGRYWPSDAPGQPA